MQKKVLLLSSIFLGVSGLHTQSACMHRFGNAFRIGAKALNYTAVLGFYPAAIYAYEKQIIKNNSAAEPLEPEVEQFVKSTLFSAYPELAQKPTKLLRSPNGCHFFVMHLNKELHLFVGQGFTQEGLQQAYYFQTHNLERFNEAEKNERSKGMNLNAPEWLAKGELFGYALTPSSISIWQCILKHEGSHMVHDDDSATRRALKSLPLFVLYGTEKIKNLQLLKTVTMHPLLNNNIVKGIGSLASLPLKLAAVAYLITPLRYWQEYRADQDAIKHTPNAKMLNAMAHMYANAPEFVPNPGLVSYFLSLIHTHPSNKTRAAYFKKAAERLEATQKKAD